VLKVRRRTIVCGRRAAKIVRDVDSVRLPAPDAETLRGWTDLVLSPTGTPRIYADFNGLGNPDRTEGRLAVALDTLGTVRDLTNAGLRLAEGLRLTVYDWSDDEEDLEAEATARYDPDDGLWWAELDPSGCQYVPKRERATDPRFLCLGCRYDLASDPTAWGEYAPRVTVCPLCGTAVAAAVAPPVA
jgi:hypothetical protein